MLVDWHQFHLDETTTPAVVDSRRRLRICLGGFLLLLAVVFGRAVQLEVTQGAAFRAEACKPIERQISLPGVRGRILACDGTVLARDEKVLALAVHYRYLQQPPDAGWLQREARSRLTRAERKDPQQVSAEQAQVLAQRDDLARRLVTLCGVSTEEWNRRAGRIQTRVERIAEAANRRQQTDAAQPDAPSQPPPATVLGRIGRLLAEGWQVSLDELRPPRITVAEELDYHVMAEGVPLAVVAEIEGHPEQYPDVKMVQRARRAYPGGPLAAHVLGHLGPVQPTGLRPGQQNGYHAEDLVGRMGVERQYELLLRGERGLAVELTDRSGRILSSHRERAPGVGRDLVLTLDPQLQRAAETLLDSALQRRAIQQPAAGHPLGPAGGAIVVIDVRSGAVRAAASAPRFDPNLFVGGERSELAALLSRPDDPLFDRTSKMAIPPGSVFKIVATVALLEAGVVDPNEPFACRGYLHQPDRQRCAIYRRQGIGHGELALADALAQSCNVYFLHHCGQMGPEPLVDWAGRFGFGRATGVDLPEEAAGLLPDPIGARAPQDDARESSDAQLMAIGQGPLTVTPLQAVRLMAAVANGGQLVTPHVLSRLGLPQQAEDASPRDDSDDPIQVPPPQPVAGLHPETLAAVREGLNRAVSDASGTAYGTVRLDSIAVAGKTGTAETGGDRGDHAWFAGYVPAERPKLAFVVVLEHAGDGATAAGPAAKRLVLRMKELNML
jgi:penicillin-binding protein 2